MTYAATRTSSPHGAQYLWPFLAVIISAIWLAVISWVHGEVGGVGTGVLFAILAWVVGAPGVVALGLICTCWVLFVWYLSIADGLISESVPFPVGFTLWCGACWVGSMIIGVVWPIVIVLKGVAQAVA